MAMAYMILLYHVASLGILGGFVVVYDTVCILYIRVFESFIN